MSEFYDSFIGGELFASERQLYSLADDDDMRRLIYVCKSMDKNTVLNHLESIAYMYDEVNESLSTVAKLRVMLCMSQIDCEAAADQAALRGIKNLGHYIMKLFLLIPLEKVGVVHSISEFDSMDVQSIVKNLLQRNWQSNVGLAAKFCLVTSIFNHSVWENILKIMINSSMNPVTFGGLTDLFYTSPQDITRLMISSDK
ncbi:hypothetical protein J437_LFUL009240 [Ladona fulva]|uniref:RZZ complex subunit KNTC1/ROD C-terminal domain-containing protein n=1 Tax=Ladona fulva TaxID=123851 RepID=A0A8K0KHN3_LADFU|nr:hypothetical protein J437_LFUL009240 [Ladona fulva]